MFDQDVAPFQQKYIHLVEEIHGVYGTAKEVSGYMRCSCDSRKDRCVSSVGFTHWHVLQFHAKGIQMLVDEFNYHVAYKRWDDTFSAIPFKPK